MDQEPEEPKSKTISLGTPEGWFQIHNETGIFGQESGLILIGTRPSQLHVIAAAAYVALRFSVGGESAEPRYPKQLLVMPPGATEDDCRKGILKGIQSHMTDTGSADTPHGAPHWTNSRRKANGSTLDTEAA